MTLETLQIVPPQRFRGQFREDYEIMQTQMIYRETIGFDTIIAELRQLTELFQSSGI